MMLCIGIKVCNWVRNQILIPTGNGDKLLSPPPNKKFYQQFFFKNNKKLKQIRFIYFKADRIAYEFLKQGKADLSGIEMVVIE